MAIIPVGLSQFVFTGNAAVDIRTAAWEGNLTVLYTVNVNRTGWLSYKPNADFPTITQLEKDKFYVIESVAEFDLPGAKVTA
jgi:hypothetical protein